jgi:cytochrome c oxidase subunit I
MSAGPNLAEQLKHEQEHEDGDHRAPGTMVLVLLLLTSFAVYYFANWKALADVWHVR